MKNITKATLGVAVAALLGTATAFVMHSTKAGNEVATTGADAIISAGANNTTTASHIAPDLSSSAIVISEHTGVSTDGFTPEEVAALTAPTFNPDFRVFGKSNPFVLADLPDSTLKATIDALDPEAKVLALKTLNSMSFTTHELEMIKVSREGLVFYEEAFHGIDTATQVENEPADVAYLVNGDVFSLSSRPGSANVMYLDFDGHIVENKAWNYYNQVDRYDALPFDLDGNPNSFNETERANIYEIWRRVADHFAPFDINVTTEVVDLTNDTTVHVLFTPKKDANDTPMPSTSNPGVQGVAYFRTFGEEYSDYAQPVFSYSFTNPRQAALVASHEAGHALHLSHDGDDTRGYYSGHGIGSGSWGPIMGNPFHTELVHWSNGDSYPNPSNTEDDLGILRGLLGAVKDDHGNTTSDATALTISAGGTVTTTTRIDDPNNENQQNEGVLEGSNDVDVFSFDTDGGDVELQVFTLDGDRSVVGNANLKITLVDQWNNVVGSADPAAHGNDPMVDASISTTLGAGRYFLSISTGSDSYIPFSTYGAMGGYYIGGTIAPGTGGNNVDTTAPNPNPMQFAEIPAVQTDGSVSMRAVTATDQSAVSYAFECSCCNTSWSDWKRDTLFVVNNLPADTWCEFSVKAKDEAGNETQPSAKVSVKTPAEPEPENPDDGTEPEVCPAIVSGATIYVYGKGQISNQCGSEGQQCDIAWVKQRDGRYSAEAVMCSDGKWIGETEANEDDNVGPDPSACPNGVFGNGKMYDSELNYTDNTCNPVGATCDSVYFYSYGRYATAQCASNGWILK